MSEVKISTESYAPENKSQRIEAVLEKVRELLSGSDAFALLITTKKGSEGQTDFLASESVSIDDLAHLVSNGMKLCKDFVRAGLSRGPCTCPDCRAKAGKATLH